MKNEEKGFLICWITVVGMMAALAFHCGVERIFHRGWPYNTFLFRPDDAWNDFLTNFDAVRSGNGPYSIKANVYFPFAFVPLYLISGLNRMTALLGVMLAFLVTAVLFVRAHLLTISTEARRLIAAVLILASYPVWYCLDRGNLEMVVFICLAAFILAYQRKQFFLSVLFLAMAGAMKIYPLIFGVLFIADRRYKEVFLTALLTFIALLAPLLFFPGGFHDSLFSMGGNLHIMQRSMKAGLVGLSYSVSLYAVSMHLGHFITHRTYTEVYEIIEWAYPAVCLVLIACLTVYIIRVETIYWRRAALLVFCLLIFPQLSLDYKMIHLLIPIAAFIAAPPDRWDRRYAWLFGLLLIPKAYYYFTPNAPLGVFINPLLMCVFGAFLIADRMMRRETIA